MTSSTTRQSRTVTLVYGSLALALLMTVAVLALVVAPPSPPAIAEFAPQAEETIEEAPQDQSSRFGRGPGGECAEGGECAFDATTTSLAGPAEADRTSVVRARVRRCVGDPPRQTEDPQSPPCVNYFEGDNGGATYKGVTRDTITVVVPEMGGQTEQLTKLLAQYFGRRYELFGRQLRVETFEQRPEFIDEAPYQRAMAARVDEEIKGFAVLGVGSDHAYFSTDGTPYYDELSRRGIIAIDPASVYRTEAELSAKHPYQWSYLPSVELAQRNYVEFACKNLAAEPAQHSGDAIEATRTRRFGVVVPRFAAFEVPSSIIVDGLRRCGGQVERFEVAAGYDERESMGQLVPRLRAAGITTPVCLCASGEFQKFIYAVYSANWLPEIAIAGMPGQDVLEPPGNNQADFQVFGIGAEAKRIPLSDQPWFQALKEVAPDFAPNAADRQMGPLVYRGMLVLASGIQAAGPRLTPESFARGLQTKAFSNPNAGGPPYFQGRVSFGAHDHTGVDDFTALWISRTPDGQPRTGGGWCYLERGRRRQLGGWTPGMTFFDASQPCR